MKCSIKSFKENVTEQMLQYGYGMAAMDYSSNASLKNTIQSLVSINQIPKKITAGPKSYRGFDIATKITKSINETWKSAVAKVEQTGDIYSIRININSDLLDLLKSADATAEERSAFNDIAPTFANSLEEEAIAYYENMKTTDIEKFVSAQSNNFLSNVLSTLQTAFPSVNYKVISDTEAREITKASANPYTGQGVSFFYKGTVYIIEGNVTPETLIHEYLHPLVKSIEVENPILFENLFNESVGVDQAYELGVAKRLQDEINEDPDAYAFDEAAYKREFITRVLQNSAQKRLLENREEGMLYNFFNKLFYALKKIFRKIFGSKVNVGKLSAYTSLSDLADMLKNSEFDLNANLFTTDEFVEYLRSIQDSFDKLSKDLADSTTFNKIAAENPANIDYGLSNLENYLNQLDRVTSQQYEYFKDNKTIDKEIRAIIFDSSTGNLNKLKQILNIKDKFDNIEQLDLEEELKNSFEKEKLDVEKAKRLISSMLQLQAIVKNLTDDDYKLLKDKTSIGADENLSPAELSQRLKDNLALIEKMKKLLDSYNVFATSLAQIVNRIDFKSELGTVLADIINRTQGANDILEKQRFLNIKDVIAETTNAVNDIISSNYDEAIAKIDTEIAANGSNKVLESRRAYYVKIKNELLVSEQKVEDLLSGKAGDSSFVEGFILSAIQSSDPIFGTLGGIVKNAYNNIEANIVNVYNAYYEKLNELQNLAGITKLNYVDMYKKIMYVGSRNVTELEEGDTQATLQQKKDVYKFLHSTLMDDALFKKAELEAKIKQALKDNNINGYIDARKELDEHLNKYFFSSTTDGSGERKILLSYDWGKRIYAKQLKLEGSISWLEAELNTEKLLSDNSEEAKRRILQILNNIKELELEYKEITSLYNLDGSMKPEDSQEYKDAKAYEDFYAKNSTNLEIKIEETKDKFIEAYKLNEALLGADSEEFEDWIAQNTYQKKTDAFYENRERIIKNLNELNQQLPQELQDLNSKRLEIKNEIARLKALYEDRKSKDVLIDFIRKEALDNIKRLQDELYEIELQLDEYNYPDFRIEDLELVRKVNKLYKAGFDSDVLKNNNAFLYSEYNSIREEMAQYRKEQPYDATQQAINKLFQELGDMQTTELTSAYKQYRYAVVRQNEGNPRNLEFNSTDKEFLTLMQKKEFAEFIENHHTRYEVSDGYGEVIYGYVPTDIHYEKKVSAEYKDMVEFTNGKGEETSTNFPIRTYHSYRIKEELAVPRILGVTVNAKGEWLPKPIEVLYIESKGGKIDDYNNIPEMTQDEYNSFRNNDTNNVLTYVNTAYYDLKHNDKNLWNLLEYLKKISFNQQQGVGKSSRLDFQVPSFFAHNFEVAQKLIAGEEKSKFSTFLSSITAKLWGKQGDEAEEGFSNIVNAETPEEQKNKLKLVSLDFFGDEISKIPVAGKYPIELDKVSMDIPYSMFRYFYSLEEVKEKVKIMPIAKGIEKVLQNESNGLKDMTAINSSAFLSSSLTIFANKKGNNIRKMMVEDFNRRIFEGENIRGLFADKPQLLKVFQTVSQFTGTVFLSTPESAIRNRVQMGLQNIINLAAQDGVDRRSYAKGEAWAIKYMFGQTTHAYQGGTYTVEQMLVDMFDPKQGSSKQRIGRSFNRSYTQDAADWQSFILAPRTWLETEGAIKLWAQRMYYEKVKIVENGVESEIPYMEAWEIKDGKLSLKEGIDKTYAPGGVKFNLIKNRIYQQIQLTNGDTSALGRSYGDKFPVWNMLLSMKRFFYMMFMNRFGTNFKHDKSKSIFNFGAYSFTPRINFATGDVQEGFYITSLRFIVDFFKNTFTKNPQFGVYWSTLTPYEKKNLIKAFTEVMFSLVFFIIIRMLFEYDPDDEDRYKKLRANSAPFPLLGTADEGEFRVGGFAYNKALQLILGFQNEHNTFIPLPGMGLKTYTTMTEFKFATVQPSLDLIYKTINYLALATMGDERAFYDKRVGPYDWQQKEAFKVLNLLFKYIGLTGTTIDPVLDIQTKESMARR